MSEAEGSDSTVAVKQIRVLMLVNYAGTFASREHAFAENLTLAQVLAHTLHEQHQTYDPLTDDWEIRFHRDLIALETPLGQAVPEELMEEPLTLNALGRPKKYSTEGMDLDALPDELDDAVLPPPAEVFGHFPPADPADDPDFIPPDDQATPDDSPQPVVIKADNPTPSKKSQATDTPPDQFGESSVPDDEEMLPDDAEVDLPADPDSTTDADADADDAAKSKTEPSSAIVDHPQQQAPNADGPSDSISGPTISAETEASVVLLDDDQMNLGDDESEDRFLEPDDVSLPNLSKGESSASKVVDDEESSSAAPLSVDEEDESEFYFASDQESKDLGVPGASHSIGAGTSSGILLRGRVEAAASAAQGDSAIHHDPHAHVEGTPPLQQPARPVTVRYYRTMKRHRLYPVSVSISEAYFPGSGGDNMPEVAGPWEIEPIFPGCVCQPTKATLTVGRQGGQARFWIQPQIDGVLPEACVWIRPWVGPAQAIRTKARVLSDRWMIWALALTLILPLLSVWAWTMPGGPAAPIDTDTRQGVLSPVPMPITRSAVQVLTLMHPEWWGILPILLAAGWVLWHRPRPGQTRYFLDPHDPNAQFLSAQRQLAAGNVPTGLDNLDRLARRYPDWSAVWRFLGHWHVQQGNDGLALDYFTPILTQGRGRVIDFLAAAGAARRQSRWADAYRWLHQGHGESLQSTSPAEEFRPVHWYAWATVAMQLHRPGEAVDCLQQALTGGYRTGMQLMHDPLFTSLRGRSDFEQLCRFGRR